MDAIVGNRSRALTRLRVLCAVALGALLPAAPAFAEGSVDINVGPNTASRNALMMLGDAQSLVENRNRYSVLRVYARAGETVQLASSAMLAASGVDNILVYAPGTSFASSSDPSVRAPFPADPVFSTAIFNCNADDPGTGRIASRAEELAGPAPNPGGYVPCEFTAPADGVYPIVMMPHNPAATHLNVLIGSVAPGAAGGGTLSAWDVTVRDAGGAVQPGRLFSHRLSFSVGSSPPATGPVTYLYTPAGYEYRVSFFAHNGALWEMAANAHGVVDATTRERIFASFQWGINNSSNTLAHTEALAPQITDPDRALDSKYPIFLRRPDPVAISGPGGLAATRGYAAAPISPSGALSGLGFTGAGGEPGATSPGTGGTIRFTAPPQMAGLGYTVELDLNDNGTFGDGTDVVDDTGDLAGSGTTAFTWSGRDASGAAPGCGTYSYRVRATLAEVHLTQSDVENSGGTQIERLSLPGDPALGSPFTASYNDIDPYKGTAVTNTSPSAVTDGVSGAGFHSWTGGTGNADFVDTWMRLPEVTSSSTLRVECADLELAKSASPSPVVPGRNVTFSLKVTNHGPNAARDVVVSDPLPADVSFVSASAGCADVAGTVRCTLGSLPSGQSHTFTITGKVASSLDRCLENSASVSSDTFDPSTGNDDASVCVPLTGRADLSIAKTPSRTSVPAGGGQVMYTLVVRNHGPSDATGVTVTDPVPAGLTLVAADASQGSCSTAGGELACDLGALRDGGSAQVLVTAQTSSAPGPVTNTARVTAGQTDPNLANNASSATVTVRSGPPQADARFDLVAAKRANVTTASVGEAIRYTITVTNKGPAAAPEVSITDTLNAPATLVSATPSAGSCGRRLPLRCSLGTIAAGATVTVGVVANPKQSGRRQRNAVSATGAGTDGNPADNLATADVTVRKVRLRLSKVADRSTVTAGGLVSYTVRVTNPTRGTARDITTCDRLPRGLAYVSSQSKAKRRAGSYCWAARTIGPRQTKRYRITVRTLPGASGRKVNRVRTNAPQARKAQARRTIRVLPATAGGLTG